MYPYFGLFLAILGISGENGVLGWSPIGCKPEKTIHHPSWAISEALPREYLGPGHFFSKVRDSMVWEGKTCPKTVFLEGGGYNPLAESAKLIIGRASEMTPEGWCTVFSAGLHPLGGTPFSPEIPKFAKKCPK